MKPVQVTSGQSIHAQEPKECWTKVQHRCKSRSDRGSGIADHRSRRSPIPDHDAIYESPVPSPERAPARSGMAESPTTPRRSPALLPKMEERRTRLRSSGLIPVLRGTAISLHCGLPSSHTPCEACGVRGPPWPQRQTASVTKNVDPCPGADSNRIDPPIASTHSATIARPRPVPVTPSALSRSACAR
jgi:hypothetical protein